MTALNFLNKRYLLVIMIAFLFLCGTAEAAGKVVTVQSVDVKPYNEALAGFKKACGCDVKNFVISDIKGTDPLKAVREESPDVIVAIGNDAFNKAKKIKNIPIIYMMILDPQSNNFGESNVTGVNMNISPERQLVFVQQTLPGVRSIGLLYDPLRTGDFVSRARYAASAMGIELITREVRSPREVPDALKGMKGLVNAFWMLPDMTVIIPETVELLLLFSFENRMPLVTFSDKYLDMGALISLDIDAGDIGKQAGEMARKVLSGTGLKNIQRSDARSAIVSINQKIAKKLRININGETAGKVRIVN